MFSVALIGPDGAGKTTVAKLVERTLGGQAKYIYMGVNLEASNCMSPLSRLLKLVRKGCGALPDKGGPRDPDEARHEIRRGWPRGLAQLRSWLGFGHRALDEWYRQAVAWIHQWRGRIVIFDRHYYPDYYAYDIDCSSKPAKLTNRVHGLMLERFFPKPDLLILLDAPGEVLFARKGEGSVALLDRRRSDYLSLRTKVNHFAVVDANQDINRVARSVTREILRCRRQSV